MCKVIGIVGTEYGVVAIEEFYNFENACNDDRQVVYCELARTEIGGNALALYRMDGIPVGTNAIEAGQSSLCEISCLKDLWTMIMCRKYPCVE